MSDSTSPSAPLHRRVLSWIDSRLYGPIWLAVVVLIIEGLKHVSRQRRSI